MQTNDIQALIEFLPQELASFFKEASFYKRPEFHTKRRELVLGIQLPAPLDFEVYENLIDKIKLAFHCALDLSIQTKTSSLSINELARYIAYFIQKDNKLSCFRHLSPVQGEQSFRFITSSEEKASAMKRQLSRLQQSLASAGIDMEIGIDLSEDDAPIEQVKIELPAYEKAQPPKPAQSYTRYKKEAAPILKIHELQQGLENVAIEAHIFDIDNRVTKAGKTLQMLYLSDYDEAIVAKRFEGKRHTIESIESIQKGMQVKVTGDVVYDTYSKTNAFMISKIEEIPVKKRKDTSEEKRIEWHVHSNFSEMDGVCDIEEYIQTAYDWGMEAIAICDHQVVQAFPMAQHKVSALLKKNKDRPFKMMYGCEMSMVDPEYKIVHNNDHRTLEDSEYVVFDLETTGLSNRLDSIIEFGAVKIKGRDVIDRKQLFINPKRTIPANIISLTNIHQSDVDTAKPIEEVLQDLLDWIGDAILVAHNATFDVGFMNAACRQVGLQELSNPVIDTLPLAHSLLDLKRYKLGNVCRHYGIKYDGEGAHRADYDAEVLSLVLFHMLNAFGGEATLDDLQNNQKEDSFKKVKPSHITVFAKNKAGLKELFELITLSHTKYLAYNGKSTENVVAEPRIPRFELEKMHAKGNLLFGSACQNGEIFDLAHTRDHQKLKEAMRFYDYIEVQPLECYRNLIDRGSILNGDDLRKIIGYILEATQEEGKTVIATSDAHYVHPYEKRIRDIYINAKAIGNARHPLYKYKLQDRRMYPAPNQNLLTTQEMLDAFAWIGEEQARQIVIENPKKLAGQMEVIYPIKDKLYPPDFEGSDQKLRDICMETAHQWYGDDLPDIVVQRLQRELDSIIGAGYYVVYYISHLLVKKSREDGYLVGSRGSVGSSFVATMSGITEVNPLLPHYICHHCHHYEFLDGEEVKSGFDLPDKECPICHHTMRGDGQDIPFETFLGFEGDKVPDIDLNFSGEYQANAHAYTKEVFGEDHVFRAGTVGTVQEKTAYGFVRGYEEEMDLEIPFSEVKRTDLAKGCEGVKRTTGQHPGGIVVVPLDMDVHDFTPVQYPANNPYAEWKTTHFDFHQIHDNILKFDILGHVDPTAMKMLERMTGIDVTTIPMNDPKTMSIFSSLDGLDINSTRYSEVTGAAGIPEFGTPFVRGILEMTKPKTFAELVTISGLSHGTNVWLSNAKDLIENGTCQLNEVIGCRDDIMVDLMGYGLPPKQSFTIMESVRKGKGLKDEWEQLMKEHNVPDWYIDSCKKIKYMFPKAHAVAYVMMAVRIAWFKVHKPVYYYCQYFSIRCDAYDIETMIKGEEAIRKRMSEIKMNKDQNSPKEKAIYDTLELALEMVLRGFRFTNLSINRSAATEFRVNPDNEKEIIPPFTALDGLGDNVGRSIVKAREEQPFLSKEDVLKRTLISKTLLDKLSQMNATEGLDEKNQLTLF